MSVGEVADFLRVSDQSVIRWIKSGRLLASRPGGREYRIDPEEVRKLVPFARYVDVEEE